MNTIVFHPESDPNAVRDAAAILRRGGLLGIPTETVYGLGADALNEDAVSRIFLAKGRPQDNPLIIHVPDASWLERYCRSVPPAAYQLAERFWPGPLTMILPRRDIVPLQTTGGLETVGVRCPNHPVTLAIIEAAGVPIAAPSGNTSGRPSPTTAPHMIEDMDGRIDGIVDGGPCTVGVESTIIDLTVTPPRLLRPGGLPLESLRQVLGEVAVDKAVTGLLAAGERPRAPGMKYRHYAPHAPVTVVTGEPERSARRIQGLLSDTAGVICFDEYAPLFPGHIIHKLGPAADKSAQARHVFDALRTFDGTDVTEIFAQCPDDGGLGLAVANRLKKAAGFHLVDADRPVLIGLTGGTGAGKSSALAALEDLGGTVLDCDAVYHQMLRTDPALREAITAAFGPVFCPDGSLDRQKLGTLVFSDHAALDRLNAIVYEYLPPELLRRAQGHTLVGLDAISLMESGLGRLCACTVAVLAPAEDRVRRIMARDGISEDYARLRISAQQPDAFYRERCSHILENNCATPAQFRDQARIFFRSMLREIEHL
ncbi:MAG: L-threonylcarbamoyladenylate synthase [Oscillospiraceae bacterium]|nr:L-threonylcarbamoyladenylate synthase [Oscillospiraceae bacterium]